VTRCSVAWPGRLESELAVVPAAWIECFFHMQLVSAEEYQSWVDRHREFFDIGKSKLLDREGPLADRLLGKSVERADGSVKTVHLGNPAYARSAAWEDLDCKVSVGHFARDAEGLGVETRRSLEPQRYRPVVWRGSEAFHALFRRMLRMHCLHEMMDFLPATERPEESADPDDVAVLKADAIRNLSRFEEILLQENRISVAETANAVVAHLEQPGILLSDWQHDSFWNDVGARIGLRGNALAARKHRFFDCLVEMREELPDWLQTRARRVLAGEAEATMDDLGRLRHQMGDPVVEAIIGYYLAFLALQNPDYSRKSLDELRGLNPALLVRRRGNPDVGLWPPPGSAFEAFCRTHDLLPENPIEQVRAWIADVAVRKPTPKRALSALEFTFADQSTAQDQATAYAD
jgi:hypothetical protein